MTRLRRSLHDKNQNAIVDYFLSDGGDARCKVKDVPQLHDFNGETLLHG